MMLVWLACMDLDKGTSSTEPISVEAWVDDKKVASESVIDLHVQLRYLPEYSPTILPPISEGLNIELIESADLIWIGSQQQQLFHYALSGEDGSYVVQPATVNSDLLDDKIEANLIYVDIGTAPQAAQLAEAVPPPKTQFPWVWICVLMGTALLVVGSILYTRRRVQKIKKRPV